MERNGCASVSPTSPTTEPSPADVRVERVYALLDTPFSTLGAARINLANGYTVYVFVNADESVLDWYGADDEFAFDQQLSPELARKFIWDCALKAVAHV